MNVRCDSCETVYRVDPAKVPPDGVRARCTVCSNVFTVSRNGETGIGTPATSAAPAVPVASPVPPAPAHVPSTRDRVANSLGDAFIPIPEDEPLPVARVQRPAPPPPPPPQARPVAPPVAPAPFAAAPRAPVAHVPPPPPAPRPVAPPPAPPAPPVPAPQPPVRPVAAAPPPPPAPVAPFAPAAPPPTPRVSHPDAPTEPMPAVRPEVARPELTVDSGGAAPPAEPKARVSRPFAPPRDIPTPPVEPRRPTAPVFRPTPGMPVQPVTAPPTGGEQAPRRPVNPFLSRDPRQKARRLARALISDMIVYQPEKRQKALKEGNLAEAFDEEIKKSWGEYVEQVGEEIATSTNHFNEALNEILAGGQQIF